MKTRNCLALVLSSALAVGCASARAQDGPGNPPPGPQPVGPPPQGVPPQAGQPGRRPPVDPAEMRRRMSEKLSEMEKAKADMEAAKDRTPDADRRIEEVGRHIEMLKNRIAQIDKGEPPTSMEVGARPERRPPGPDGPVNPGGPMRREGPTVEQRLEMIERAVHELRELFERHGVAPEMRERAEREMRERMAGGPPPGGRPGEGRPDGRRPADGPDAGPRLGMGGPPPGGPDGRRVEWRRPADGREPQSPPMPPRAAGDMPNMDDVRRQIEAAHDTVEALKKQLADTQAALAKAQAEIEEMRKGAAGK